MPAKDLDSSNASPARMFSVISRPSKETDTSLLTRDRRLNSRLQKAPRVYRRQTLQRYSHRTWASRLGEGLMLSVPFPHSELMLQSGDSRLAIIIARETWNMHSRRTRL